MHAASRASLALVLLGCIAHVAAVTYYEGDMTYYGDNGWAGWCAGNVPNEGKQWPPSDGQFGNRIALNSAQFSSDMCGKKIMYKAKGGGAGANPPPDTWTKGQITNLCPECKYGDIDMGIPGDGRWGVVWYFVDDAGSGGNAVQSSSTASRAQVPNKTTPSSTPSPTPSPTPKAASKYNWRSWLQKQRAARAAENKVLAWRIALARRRAQRAHPNDPAAVAREFKWRVALLRRRYKRGDYNKNRKLLL